MIKLLVRKPSNFFRTPTYPTKLLLQRIQFLRRATFGRDTFWKQRSFYKNNSTQQLLLQESYIFRVLISQKSYFFATQFSKEVQFYFQNYTFHTWDYDTSYVFICSKSHTIDNSVNLLVTKSTARQHFLSKLLFQSLYCLGTVFHTNYF